MRTPIVARELLNQQRDPIFWVRDLKTVQDSWAAQIGLLSLPVSTSLIVLQTT